MRFEFFSNFGSLQFDIVGIVAVLGEGGTQRYARASALSWHHLLPRLYPAPQSLLKHVEDNRLPIEPGIVVGARSGRIRTEINFFTSLLHDDDLPQYSVELLAIERKNPIQISDNNESSKVINTHPPFDLRKNCFLTLLSWLGFCIFIAVLSLSIWQKDGRAFLAALLLSATSSLAGLATKAEIEHFEEAPNKEREDKVPLGDVIIYYPRTGAFRVVRCTDRDSRLYFRVEEYRFLCPDTIQRLLALAAIVALISGLVMLGNASAIMQAAFAASYITLNILYWGASARNPKKHVWESDFRIIEIGYTRRMTYLYPGDGSSPIITPECSELSPPHANTSFDGSMAEIKEEKTKFLHHDAWTMRVIKRSYTRSNTISMIARPGDYQYELQNLQNTRVVRDVFKLGTTQKDSVTLSKSSVEAKKTMSSALWTVISLTGSSLWARTSNIAPNNEVWDLWLKEAEEHANRRCKGVRDSQGKVWITFPAPPWNYQARLTALFAEHGKVSKGQREIVDSAEDFQRNFGYLQKKVMVIIAFQRALRRYRERKSKRAADSQSSTGYSISQRRFDNNRKMSGNQLQSSKR